MGHTRGGGIGNMAGSYDHTRKEVEAELRQRIIIGGGYGDITEDELDRLIGKTSFRKGSATLDRETMLERLEWFANEGYGNEMPDWLAPNVWGKSVAELATAALDELKDADMLVDLRHSADMLAIARWRQAAPGRELKQPDHTDLCVWLLDQHRAIEWRPIAEAPIPPLREAPIGFIFNCMIQTARGIVGEGCARYVSDGRVRGSKNRPILRWYYGDGTRSGNVCHDPRYFQPLPQPRKD